MKKYYLYLLPVGLLIAVTVLVISLNRGDRYAIGTSEMTEELMMMEYELMPGQALLLLNESENNIVFADIRSDADFSAGHIDKAVHLPASRIMNEDCLELIEKYRREGKTLVLYGNNQSEANGPYVLLRQVGFDNLRVLLGGYPYLKALAEKKQWNDTVPLFIEEEPRFDFRSLIESPGGGENQLNTPAAVSVINVKRKEKSSVQGGC
mgnify:CR=1 FL=1